MYSRCGYVDISNSNTLLCVFDRSVLFAWFIAVYALAMFTCATVDRPAMLMC
jgi:hypothetical protein